MMRRNIYKILPYVMIMLFLTGCGDGSEEAGLVQEAVTVKSEPLLSEAERAICDYELKYNSGTFEMQDYHALADLYQEVGKIRKQRDMLEQSYRLFNDEQALVKLQDITVNLAEEEETVVQEAQTMLQNLDIPEYQDESVNLITSSRWMRTMMPKLSEGKRSYFLQKDGRTALVIEVGYDETGKPYSNVWYVNDENQLILLQYEEDTVQMLQTTMADGVYDGAFELWHVDGKTGNIRHEQGAFAKGLYTGEYTAAIRLGTENSDLFALWSHRDTMAYTRYIGHFDEQGRTTLEQPTAENQAALIGENANLGCVVYAYDETGLNCLFLGLEEGVEPAACSFDLAMMGVKIYPDFEAYEVQSDAGDAQQGGMQSDADTLQSSTATIPSGTTELQIRIFDGEIQYYNGYRWISAGSAEQYAKGDPFYSYAEKKQEYENNLWGNESGNTGSIAGNGTEENVTGGAGEGGGVVAINPGGAGNQGMGVIATPSPTPSPTKKPAATTPVVTQKPVAVQTPVPTPVPNNPAPAPDYDDDDDDDAGTSAPAPNPAPAPEPDPAPEPEPEPDPPTDDGGDDSDDGGDSGDGEDMDWSDTII